jgi:hypothetical protein
MAAESSHDSVEHQAGFLPWEDDLEMISKYTDRKGDLEEDHMEYIRKHPELKALMADFLQALLVHKPEDTFEFARKHFGPFKTKHGV